MKTIKLIFKAFYTGISFILDIFTYITARINMFLFGFLKCDDDIKYRAYWGIREYMILVLFLGLLCIDQDYWSGDSFIVPVGFVIVCILHIIRILKDDYDYIVAQYGDHDSLFRSLPILMQLTLIAAYIIFHALPIIFILRYAYVI